jgi:hypothetical protein
MAEPAHETVVCGVIAPVSKPTIDMSTLNVEPGA